MQERFNISFKPEELGARPVHKHIPTENTQTGDLEVKTVDTQTGERVDKSYGPPADVKHRSL